MTILIIIGALLLLGFLFLGWTAKNTVWGICDRQLSLAEQFWNKSVRQQNDGNYDHRHETGNRTNLHFHAVCADGSRRFGIRQSADKRRARTAKRNRHDNRFIRRGALQFHFSQQNDRDADDRGVTEAVPRWTE